MFYLGLGTIYDQKCLSQFLSGKSRTRTRPHIFLYWSPVFLLYSLEPHRKFSRTKGHLAAGLRKDKLTTYMFKYKLNSSNRFWTPSTWKALLGDEGEMSRSFIKNFSSILFIIHINLTPTLCKAPFRCWRYSGLWLQGDTANQQENKSLYDFW